MNNIDIAKITGDIKSMNEQIQKTSELIGDLIKKQGDLNKELAGAKGLKETTDNLNKSKLAQTEIEKEAEKLTAQRNKLIVQQDEALKQLTIDQIKENENKKKQTLNKIDLITGEKEKAITAFLKEQVKERLGEEQEFTKELTKELIKRNEDAMFLLNTPTAAKPKDIYELLGITMSDDQKAAISTATEYAINALNEVADAKIDAANRAREAADLEMDAVRKRLDYEMEARSNGYASNVAQAQKDLALAKKTQDKAIAQQRQAEREKAAIASIQQAGNLVTGAAMMFSQLGAWAFPVIGAMFASFAYAKIRSAQLSRQNYGDGDYSVLQGGSHASGNDIYLGRRGGVDEFAEGGEARAIINKRSTSKYRRILPDLIKSLNKGTFENNYLASNDGSIINVMGGMSKDLESDVKEIKKQGERKYFTNGKGQTVEIYKNLKRTYVN